LSTTKGGQQPEAAEPPSRLVYGVGQVLAGLRGLLEDRVGRLWVVGEISNLHHAASGHVYFTLKDDVGQLRAALFRGSARRLRFELEEGLEVLVYAEVTVYEARGDLQLIVREVEPQGQGALQLAFEQLRQRLEAEGLFDEARKRPLPAHPKRVALVTSAGGAALRDILHVVERRAPGAQLLLSPTRVQGVEAAAEIARALARVQTRPDVELVLLARGGGSLEDLFAFNTEQLARAIAACPVPVVTGVGHEVDLTIADCVADARAATPSAAAALVFPDREALVRRVTQDTRRLRRAMTGQLDEHRARLRHAMAALRMLAPRERLRAHRARWRVSTRALLRISGSMTAKSSARLARLASRLDALSPLSVLGRGFAIAARASDGAILRSPSGAPEGEKLRIRLAEGELAAVSKGPLSDEEGSR